MKYKVGDRVKIQSLERYNRHTNGTEVDCGAYPFTSDMKEFCGQERIIANVCQECYILLGIDDKFVFTDEMIEGLVEEGTKPKFKKGDYVKCTDGSCGIIVTCDWSNSLNCYQYFIDYIGTLDAGYQAEKDLQLHTITTMNGKDIFESAKWKHEFECPDGYIFKDENSNVINATKIVLEKKKKEYPKTYEECLPVLEIYTILPDVEIYNAKPSECKLFETFIRLKRCRDAYWKIAGEEMGLGKPWEPDYDSGVNKFGIICLNGVVQESNPTTNWERHLNKVLDFPTPEMRDAFKENFDPDIEFCKELL